MAYPEPRQVQSSILLKLPAEVLHNIINQHEYPCHDDVFNFRLVCHAMNEVASHSALRVLRLSGRKAADMLSAPIKAFTQNTKVVQLHRLSQNRSSDESVCGMLKYLKNVRTLGWEVDKHSKQPSTRLLEAIGQLPHLEHIRLQSIAFPGAKEATAEGVTMDDALARLAGLKSIVVNSAWISNDNQAEAEEQLQLLLQTNPRLEHFELMISTCAGSWGVNFGTLIKSSLEAPDFQPSLRKLNAQFLVINKVDMGAAMKYLANLSSLTISNAGLCDQDLWKALGKSTIRLEEVIVEIPTDPMVTYLQSYRGLKFFCLKNLVPGRQWLREATEGEIKSRSFVAALPHHSEYLRGIHIVYPPDSGPSDFGEATWALDEDQLIWFQQFRRLESVTVSCWQGARFISLERALYGLLTELSPTVRLIRLAERQWPRSSSREELESFERMRISKPIVEPHHKELMYLGFRWHLVRDSMEEKYRFEMDDYGFLDTMSEDMD